MVHSAYIASGAVRPRTVASHAAPLICSDMYFIGHHFDVINAYSAVVARVEADGIITNDGRFAAATILLKVRAPPLSSPWSLH